MNRRAQIVIEFLAVMSFSLLLLISLLVIVAFYASNTNTDALQAGVDDVATSIAIEMTSARVLGEGYETFFYLPQRIQGRLYTITLQTVSNESVISVVSGSAQADRRLQACTGVFGPGSNRIRVTSGGTLCTNEALP